MGTFWTNKQGSIKWFKILLFLLGGIGISFFSFNITIFDSLIKYENPYQNKVENLDNSFNRTDFGKELSEQNAQTATETIPSQQIIKTENKAEDFSSYINTSFNNLSNENDVAVLIIDENGKILSPESNSISNIYKQAGNNVIIGLLRSSFIGKPEFQELYEGNSNIINNLKLLNYTDLLVIGKIKSSMRQGNLVAGTSVCTTSISVNIISARSKSISKSFTISVNGNGVTEMQAKEKALQKLLSNYREEYSSL